MREGTDKARVLTFKSKYVNLILSGRKRATIRLGRHRIYEKTILIVSRGRPVALARVDGVIVKKVRELTEEDAKDDGLSNLINLFRELRSIYGDFTLDDDVTVIRFSLIKVLRGSNYIAT